MSPYVIKIMIEEINVLQQRNLHLYMIEYTVNVLTLELFLNSIKVN